MMDGQYLFIMNNILSLIISAYICLGRTFLRKYWYFKFKLYIYSPELEFYYLENNFLIILPTIRPKALPQMFNIKTIQRSYPL